MAVSLRRRLGRLNYGKEIVEVIAQQPVDRRDQIIKDFIAMYPRYPELKALQTGIQAADKAARDPNRSGAIPT